MDNNDLLGLLGVLAVGLYWWFGRGRPLGILYTFLVSFALVVAWHRGTGQSEYLPFGIWWVGAFVMLVVGWKLPPKQPRGSRPCPFCAEVIRQEARVCRFCGKDLVA